MLEPVAKGSGGMATTEVTRSSEEDVRFLMLAAEHRREANLREHFCYSFGLPWINTLPCANAKPLSSL